MENFSLSKRVQGYENLHIVCWLVKDTCWMLEWKWLGACMVLPTIAVALYIIWQTRRLPEFYTNVAIFFWIMANSFWMLMEFFNNNRLKDLAVIPFSLGFIFVFLFYFRRRRLRGKAEQGARETDLY